MLRNSTSSFRRFAPWLIIGVALGLAAWSTVGHGADEESSIEVRRDQIEQLSPGDKQRLQAKVERFQALPEAERERLRALHAELSRDPEAEALRNTLDRYHAWLSTLTASQRAELAQLEPQARIDRIRQLLKERLNYEPWRPFQYPLSENDREAMLRWLDQNSKWLLPPDRRLELEQSNVVERRRQLGRLFASKLQSYDGQKGRGLPTELTSLRERLSPEARAQLDSLPLHGQKALLITSWLVQATGIGGNDQQLREFFERDLPLGERQRLMSLPAEQMQRELRSLYLRHYGQQQGTRPPFSKPSRGEEPVKPNPTRERTPAKDPFDKDPATRREPMKPVANDTLE